MVIKGDWLQWFKKSGVATGPSHQLASELHRQIIRKFKRRKLY